MADPTAATLREPTDQEIADGDTVSVTFIQARIDYLRQQHELCGCVGLVDTCDECEKRDFAIRELQACL